MAHLSLTEVSKRFNVNRTTIYRAVNNGKLSRLSNGLFDLAEVIRVFGEPPAPVKQSIEPPASHANDREVINILKSQVELLTKQLEKKTIKLITCKGYLLHLKRPCNVLKQQHATIPKRP